MTAYMVQETTENLYVFADEIDVLSRLYPEKHVVFVKPATTQLDGASCGVFAIAYATTIVLGDNPANYHLQLNTANKDKTMELRNHIKDMYLSKKLQLFPQQTPTEQ